MIILKTAHIVSMGVIIGCNKTKRQQQVFYYNESRSLSTLDPAFARNMTIINACLNIMNKININANAKRFFKKLRHIQGGIIMRSPDPYKSMRFRIEDLNGILNNFGKNTSHIESLIQRWNEFTHSPSIDISKMIFSLFSKKDFTKGEISQIESEITALINVIITGSIINLTTILKHTTLFKKAYDSISVRLLNDMSLSHGTRGSSGKGETLITFLCNLSDVMYEIPPLKDGDIKIKDVIYDIKYFENYNLTANFGIVENFQIIKSNKEFDIEVNISDVTDVQNKINISFDWNDRSVGIFGIPYSVENKINNPRYYLMRNDRSKKGNDGNSLMTTKIQLEITNQILHQYFLQSNSVQLMIIWGESDELRLKVLNKDNILSQNTIYCPFNKGSEFPLRLY
jgi:hypothetical protein